MYVFPKALNQRILQDGYARQEDNQFQASQPASGPYFSQILADDAAAYFNIGLSLNPSEAAGLRAWLRQNAADIKLGAQFEIDLFVEGGIATQTASFTADGIPQINGTVANELLMSARIVVPRLTEIGEGYEDLIIGALDMGEWSELAYIVNIEMPQI